MGIGAGLQCKTMWLMMDGITGVMGYHDWFLHNVGFSMILGRDKRFCYLM